MGVNDCIALLVPFFFILWPWPNLWLNFQLEFRGEKSYIDLIFSGKTNQHSVKWGDSRDTRVSNYSAKSLVWGVFSLFSYKKKWFSCFHANVSLLMVISICNPSAVSEIWLPPSQKNWNCAIVLYWKKPLYFSNQTFWMNSLK